MKNIIKLQTNNKNKGITLIALVITIIVLLILAGVSIAMLTGDNGILTKAQTAKINTDRESAKEKVQIAVLGSYDSNGKIDIKTLKENLKKTEGVTEVDSITSLPKTITSDGYKVTIEANGKVTVEGEENKEYTKNGTAIIPVEFAIVPGLDNVEEGLVISDIANDTENVGNQFVWIPVTDKTEYKRTMYANTDVSSKAIDDTEYLPEGITNEEQAVRKAKGFYIARYEAGREGTTLVSKKGATVWTDIAQENTKSTAKTMFPENSHIRSALISGIQWDMTMAFIASKDRVDGTNQPYEVTKENTSRHIGDTVTISGNNNADKVCNIYDLEGNAREFVAEKNTLFDYYPFVERGGSYNYIHPAANRTYRIGDASRDYTFRLILYVI